MIEEKENIPVEKAVQTGVVWMLIVPACIIPAGFFILFYLMGNHIISDKQGIELLFAVIVLPFIYRALGFTIWRVWAFSRVRNVHELKRKALSEDVMSRKGSLRERLAIVLPYQRQKLLEIEKKFKLEDDTNYSDLYASVYTLNLSMWWVLGRLWFLLLMLPTLVIGFIQGEYDTYFKFSCISFFLCLIYVLIKYNKRGMILQLSEKGISSRKYGFVPWENLFDEYIHTHMGTYLTNFYEYHVLIYYNRGGTYKRNRFKKRGQIRRDPMILEGHATECHEVDLDYTGVDREEIIKLLALYRKRHSEQASVKK